MRDTANSRDGLRRWAETFAGGVLVEIGVYAGDSTAILADHFEHVIAVDPWERGSPLLCSGFSDAARHGQRFDLAAARHEARRRLANKPHVTLVQAFDYELAPFVAQVDGVYIDALHTYQDTTRQIRTWLPKCRRFVGGHDYSGAFPGVRHAVDEMFASPQTFSDASWGVFVAK